MRSSPRPRLGVRRAVWRGMLRLRFLLWQRRRHDRLVLEDGLGFPLLVLPGVFNPTLFRTTGPVVRFLADHPPAAGCRVLDLGTGSGALAVAAARSAGRVVAVDLDPEAVRCARINALLNRVEGRVEVRQGELFAPVAGERFDLVLCNPPYYRGQPRSALERAFLAPDFAERLASTLPGHLAAGGSALVVLSSDGDEQGFLDAFRAAGLEAAEVGRWDLVSEVVRLRRLTPAAGAGPKPS